MQTEQKSDSNETTWYKSDVTIWYNTTRMEFPEVINGYAVKDQLCTLTITPFGDMSSFIGNPENIDGPFMPKSTGYINITDQDLNITLEEAEDKIMFTDIV